MVPPEKGNPPDMKVTFHIGAHRTDEDRLLASLQRNSRRLADQGIRVPAPDRYRDMLREVTTRLRGAPAEAETTDLLLAAMIKEDEVANLVLSYEAFICAPANIMADGGYYARAGLKCSWLRNAFPDMPVAFALAIRNPATQIPAIWAGLGGVAPETLLAGSDPRALRWSPAVEGIVAANPGCPVIVWCNEDTPLIWPEVMREVSGMAPETRLKGSYDIYEQIIAPEGMRRLRTYLTTHPPKNELQRRRIATAFLDKYVRTEEVEEEIEFPGWTEDLVEEMTAAYDADVARIAAIPGVTFLAA